MQNNRFDSKPQGGFGSFLLGLNLCMWLTVGLTLIVAFISHFNFLVEVLFFLPCAFLFGFVFVKFFYWEDIFETVRKWQIKHEPLKLEIDKKWLYRVGILGLLVVIVTGVILYAQPRTIFIIEPNKINAAGLIDKIAPGNSLTVYGKVSNPYFKSNAVKIVFVQPKQDYDLTYDLFGTGRIEDRIVPPITYSPAPKEAERWITLETDNKTVWDTVSLSPYQSKSIPLNINIPEDAQLPKHWYFIIENRNAEESGLVVTRNDCLVLVNMR